MHRGWSCFCAWFEVCWDIQSKSSEDYSRNFYQNWQNLQNTWVGAIVRFLVSRSTQTIYRNSAFIMVASCCWKERDSNFHSLDLIFMLFFWILTKSGDTELFGHLHRYATEVPKIGEAVKVSFGQELGQFSRESLSYGDIGRFHL